MVNQSRRHLLASASAAGAISLLAPLHRALASTEAFGRKVPHFTPLPDPVNLGYAVWDVRPYDYVAEEYYMEGSGEIFAPQALSPSDALLTTCSQPAVVTRDATYVTRIVLYRPRDPRRFTGHVMVETFHHQSKGHPEVFSMLNRSYAVQGFAAVTVQHVGNFNELKEVDAARYGRLSSPSEYQHLSILAQLANALRQPGRGNPLGVPARRLYMTGYSNSTRFVGDFAAFHHAAARQPNGRPLYDGYLFGTGITNLPPIDAVIMTANTQADFNRGSTYRDSFEGDDPMHRRRRYEIAGVAHAPLPLSDPDFAIPWYRELTWNRRCAEFWPKDALPDDLNQRPVLEAMLFNMTQWLDKGISPPHAPFIEMADGRARLDADGNALGGIRLPEIAMPIATYSMARPSDAAEKAGCTLSGYITPFSEAQLSQRYGSARAYLKRYDQIADSLVTQRLILPDAANRMKTHARVVMPWF